MIYNISCFHPILYSLKYSIHLYSKIHIFSVFFDAQTRMLFRRNYEYVHVGFTENYLWADICASNTAADAKNYQLSTICEMCLFIREHIPHCKRYHLQNGTLVTHTNLRSIVSWAFCLDLAIVLATCKCVADTSTSNPCAFCPHTQWHHSRK